jgi:RNA polymerase sigma factor (sigma-70 family)
VHRFVAHLVDAREAEDVTQETYLWAMRALPRFAARSSARSWLLAIARRAAADHVRAVIRRPRTTAVADWETAADAFDATEMSRFDETLVLTRVLDGLTADRREAFVASQLLGLSYAEAAEVATARSRPTAPGSPAPAPTSSPPCRPTPPTAAIYVPSADDPAVRSARHLHDIPLRGLRRHGRWSSRRDHA